MSGVCPILGSVSRPVELYVWCMTVTIGIKGKSMIIVSAVYPSRCVGSCAVSVGNTGTLSSDSSDLFAELDRRASESLSP